MTLPHSRRAWIERNADRLVPRALSPRREQVLYLAVGAWNTAFGYGVFVVLHITLGDRVGVTNVLVASYVVAVLVAYLGYRYVTFRSHGSVLRELPRFSAVYLLTLIANLVFLPVAIRFLAWNVYVVQALFTAIVVVVSYLGHRHFTFRSRVVDRSAGRHPGGE